MTSTAAVLTIQSVYVALRCRKCANTIRRPVPTDVTALDWTARQVRCPHDRTLLMVWSSSTGST